MGNVDPVSSHGAETSRIWEWGLLAVGEEEPADVYSVALLR